MFHDTRNQLQADLYTYRSRIIEKKRKNAKDETHLEWSRRVERRVDMLKRRYINPLNHVNAYHVLFGWFDTNRPGRWFPSRLRQADDGLTWFGIAEFKLDVCVCVCEWWKMQGLMILYYWSEITSPRIVKEDWPWYESGLNVDETQILEKSSTSTPECWSEESFWMKTKFSFEEDTQGRHDFFFFPF